jgi:histidinol-phosphate aminotransferase
LLRGEMTHDRSAVVDLRNRITERSLSEQLKGASTMPPTIRQQRGLDAIKPYVPGKPIEEVQREYGLVDVIKLASNENSLGPSPKVMAALQAALPELSLYPDAQAYTLCRAIAARHGVTPEMVRVGNGADGVIREICVSYLEDGDEVLTSASSFPVYDISAAVMRARMVKTPLKDLGFDLDAIAAAITARTKLIFICNPNNPTGTIVTASEVAEFMGRAPDHVIVVFDEAYYEFVDSPEYPDLLAYIKSGRYPNVVVLRTFSKAYGIAGIRLGYGIADSKLLAPLRAASESFPVNRLAQVAGLAALEDAEFMRRTVEVNLAGRQYLYREFDRLGLAYAPSHTNFILVRVGPETKVVFQKLLERGVIVRPCAGYDLPDYLRITIGTQPQNARLIAALEGVMAELGLSPEIALCPVRQFANSGVCCYNLT